MTLQVEALVKAGMMMWMTVALHCMEAAGMSPEARKRSKRSQKRFEEIKHNASVPSMSTEAGAPRAAKLVLMKEGGDMSEVEARPVGDAEGNGGSDWNGGGRARAASANRYGGDGEE